jgi:secretion/DNA translocation related TadE-like protein
MKRQDEAGSATIFMLIAMGLVGLATAVVCLLAVAITARHRAASAADAVALAAAAHAADGEATACGFAARLAAADGARLVGCSLTGPVAVVAVSVEPGGWLRAFGAATVKAKAGPAET